MKQNKYICAVLAGAAMLAASCTDFDDYNEAYTGEGSATAGQTLWQNISANENLSDFASLLQKTGYDEKLKGSQFYTVWAPVNGSYDYNAIAAHDSTWLVQRFLNNHIANFNYLSTGDINRRVHTLNEKSFAFVGNGSSFTFDGKQILSACQPSLNGTLYALDGYVEYFPNVYEYIFDVEGCDSIASYFKKYEITYLDKEASVEGPIVDGKQTYSDSVMITENQLVHNRFRAALDVEDSSYTMLIPNNDAYDKAVAAVSPAFNYRAEMPYFDLSTIVTTDVATKRTQNVDAALLSDSLTHINIGGHLMFSNNDTFNKGVFSHSLPENADTLRTTTYSKLSNGYEMLGRTVGEPIKASNGEVRIVDSLAFRPWEVWNPQLTYRSVATTYGATSASNYWQLKDTITGGVLVRYFDVVPESSSTEPHVYYYLTNVRAATYEVYVIFVSGTKPYKYSVGINYVKSDGSLNAFNSTPPFNVTGKTTDDTYLTAPNGIDTCYVGRVTIPYSYVGLGDCAPYLRVQSARGRLGNDRKNYDNNLKIAGVLLRPVEYDEYLKKDE